MSNGKEAETTKTGIDVDKKTHYLQLNYIVILVAFVAAVFAYIISASIMDRARDRLLRFESDLAEMMDDWHFLQKYLYGIVLSEQDPEAALREGRGLVESYAKELALFKQNAAVLDLGNGDLHENIDYLIAGLELSVPLMEKPFRHLEEFIVRRKAAGEGLIFPNSMFLVFRELDSGAMEAFDAVLLLWMREAIREIGYAYADIMELKQQTILKAVEAQMADLSQKNDKLSVFLLACIIIVTVIFVWRLLLIGRVLVGLVRERTSELDAALRDLSLAQDRLVQSQTLATVGNLSAGIAHELNTPIGAIRSSVFYLRSEVKEVGIPLLANFLSLPDDQEPLLLLKELVRNAEEFGGEDDRRTVKRLRSLWEARGLDPDNAFFDLVSSGSLYPLGERVADWPRDPTRDALLRLVISLTRNLSIMYMAVEKATSVVMALRGHLHGIGDQTARPTNVVVDLEQALTLHRNRLKTGIEVIRDFPELVYVKSRGNQLSQVWVNLISNAIQAMSEGGRLELSVRQRGTFCSVSIADSGPGIPESVKNKLFTPYTTTKPGGLGLGLNISKMIVEAHGGKISYESRPGNTVFTVLLPIETVGHEGDEGV